MKVADEPSEPAGTAFITAAQRKIMKKQKKKPQINKQAVKDNYAKEFKLKFREELVEFKPFKVFHLRFISFIIIFLEIGQARSSRKAPGRKFSTKRWLHADKELLTSENSSSKDHRKQGQVKMARIKRNTSELNCLKIFQL